MCGYGSGTLAPGISSPGVGEYLCMHNLIKAHAGAYHVYQNEFKSRQNGKFSTAHAINHCLPLTNSPEDVAAAGQAMEFNLEWMANPLYYGDYPEIMKQRTAFRSKAEGYPQSRLPAFTEDEKEYIKNTSDYIAINVYFTNFIQSIPEPEIGTPSLDNDAGVGQLMSNDSQKILGMTLLMVWVTEHYDKPDLIITQNGLGAATNSLEDDDRIEYVQKSLSHFRDAIDQGINVFGYTLWSLMDNFEWGQGCSQKYGIYHVDFDSDDRARTAKKSVIWYKRVIATRCLVDDCK